LVLDAELYDAAKVLVGKLSIPGLIQSHLPCYCFIAVTDLPTVNKLHIVSYGEGLPSS